MKRLALVCVLAVGCGAPSAPPDRVGIQGTVTYQGKIVPHGFVCFQSKTDANNRDTCSIRADGTYILTNAPVGPVKVVLQINGAVDAQAYQMQGKELPKDILPREIGKKYSDAATTPLELEITPGAQTIDLEIK